MKKRSFIIITLLLAVLFSLSITYAAFSDKGKYAGATFNVASADLKLLDNLTLGLDQVNLIDEKPGPTFNNISPSWFQDYPIKLYNNATTALNIFSTAYYDTINDPDELRQYIYCEIFDWNDLNNDGVISEEEIGESRGMKQLIKWKTEGLSLGQINMGEIKGYVLRFSTTNTFPTSKQGKSGVFDFEFNATGI